MVGDDDQAAAAHVVDRVGSPLRVRSKLRIGVMSTTGAAGSMPIFRTAASAGSASGGVATTSPVQRMQ